MLNSIKNLIYKIGLFIPGSEKRMIRHLRAGGG